MTPNTAIPNETNYHSRAKSEFSRKETIETARVKCLQGAPYLGKEMHEGNGSES